MLVIDCSFFLAGDKRKAKGMDLYLLKKNPKETKA